MICCWCSSPARPQPRALAWPAPRLIRRLPAAVTPASLRRRLSRQTGHYLEGGFWRLSGGSTRRPPSRRTTGLRPELAVRVAGCPPEAAVGARRSGRRRAGVMATLLNSTRRGRSMRQQLMVHLRRVGGCGGGCILASGIDRAVLTCSASAQETEALLDTRRRDAWTE